MKVKILPLAIALAALALVPALWVVVGASPRAFGELFATQPMGTWLANSLWVAGAQTLLAAVLCSLGGYALWAYDFRGKVAIIALLVTTALLPGPVAITGLFEMLVAVGGLDALWAVILPGAFSVFGIFLFAAAYRAVPRSRLEAARLDGCGEIRVWWSIVWPSVRPATAAFALLHFLGAWNALAWPAAVLVSEPKQTLAVALANLSQQAQFEADPALLRAAVVVAVAPVMLLFLLIGGGILNNNERPGA